jgi:hypothetical protein
MSDTLNSAELEAQHVELLPARTVLSLFSLAGNGGSAGKPGAGGQGTAGVGFNWNLVFGGSQNNISSMGFNGPSGSANHG